MFAPKPCRCYADGRIKTGHRPCPDASWTLPSEMLSSPRCRDRLEDTTSDGGVWSEERSKTTLSQPCNKATITVCQILGVTTLTLVLYRASGGRLRTAGTDASATEPAQLARPVRCPVAAPLPGSVAERRPRGPTASEPCSPLVPVQACRRRHSQSSGRPRRASWGCAWRWKGYRQSTACECK